MLMQKVVLYGVSSIIPVFAEFLRESGAYDPVVLTVHRAFYQSPEFAGFRVIPFEELAEQYPPDQVKLHVVTPMGEKDFRLRKQQVAKEAERMGYTLFNFIHPKAYVAASATLGRNVFICPNATVEPLVRIGDGVLLRSNAYVSHEASVGDWSFLSARATVAGKARIGKYCFIGVNSTVRDRITIGDRSIVGGGAVALRSLPEKGVLKAAEGTLLDRDSGFFNI